MTFLNYFKFRLPVSLVDVCVPEEVLPDSVLDVLVVRDDAELSPGEQHQAGEVSDEHRDIGHHHPDLAQDDRECGPDDPGQQQQTVSLKKGRKK